MNSAHTRPLSRALGQDARAQSRTAKQRHDEAVALSRMGKIDDEAAREIMRKAGSL